ncbi:hypothetical protein ACS0TY_003717 [Phlomoides rotata]
MCEGSDEIKENKLIIAIKKFDTLKMLSKETINQFDSRFTIIINELNDLDNEFTKNEDALRILRALHQKKWRTKATIIKDTKDLTKMTTQQLFSTLKAHEFNLNYDEEVGETSLPTPTKYVAFKATKSDSSKRSECKKETQHDKEQADDSKPDLSDMNVKETMSLILKRFDKISNRYRKYKKFYNDVRPRGHDSRRSSHTEQRYKSRSPNRNSKKPESSSRREVEDRPNTCYNCQKSGHFIHECPELNFKEREERRVRRDKKFAKQKAMLADMDSADLPSLLSSDFSSDGDLCLMANEEDEVQSKPSSSSSSSVTHEPSSSAI